MRPHPPSPAIVKSGLARAPRKVPSPPDLGRRGRWSPPLPPG